MDKLICLVGPSGAGKTTIAKELEKEGYNIIHSYTDREPREINEWGHTFIKKTDIPMMKDVIAYRVIYGDRYYALRHQYKDKGTSIYAVCPDGAKQVQENVKDAEVITIFLIADEIIRRERIAKRNNIKLGHSAKEHFELQEDTERLDEYFKIFKEIQDRVTKDKDIFKTCKCDYVIDANRTLEEVVKDVMKIIEE